MKLFGYSKRTQDTYLYAIRKLTKHFQTSPDQITNEQLREYLLWHKDKYARNTTTIALCGIKFYYQKILKKPMPVFDLARQPRGTKRPVVLTREEVHAVLTNIRVLRHRACLSLIYSCGPEASGEAVSIKVSQIDSKRMVVHVQFGKGARDRYVPLPQSTLELLRQKLDHSALKDTTEPAPEAEQQSLPKTTVCRCCGQPMLVVATIPRGGPWPKASPPYATAFSQHPSKQTANPL